MKITARSALAAVCTVLILAACSSSSDDATSGDGGPITTLPDGALADGADGANAPDTAPPPCGKDTTLCAEGQPCNSSADCVSDFCQTICTEPGHVDGVKDDGETGIDCGGSAPNKCPPGQGCLTNADCNDVACDPSTMICQPASHTDGITNDGETGVDCGGTAPTKCPTGQGCLTNADCDAVACNTTAMPPVCETASHTDGIKNLDETGIDCGGPTAPNKCPPGQGCAGDGDCANTRCDTVTLVCDPPTSSDGLQNGTETDIDCGGGAPTNAPKCLVGQKCGAANTDANCASNVCNYNSLCVESPSCRNQNGGDTCGPSGTESCCVSPAAGGMHLDKYSITAGRMRTFVEDAKINGNIHDYIVNNKPSWWNDTWTQYLPTVMDNLGNTPADGTAWSGFYQDVGPYVFGTAMGGNEGCDIRNNGARTYRLPDAVNTRMKDEQDYTQAFLDQRPMNCTPVYIFAAFCAWDGGQIVTRAILESAWGTGTYPWGNPATPENAKNNDPGVGNPAGYDIDYPTDPKGTFGTETYGTFDSNPKVPAPFNPNPDELWANYSFNYWGGASQATSATCSGAPKDPYCDQSIFIAPPGRFPNGNSATGHSDLAGNVFNSTLDFTGANVYWSRNGSWEAHAIPYNAVGHNSSFPSTNKYLAMGSRCMRP